MRTRRGSRLSADVAVTLLARILPGLLALLAVPAYVRLLGVRSYAVVGLFLTMQAIIGLLDFGLSSTVTREVAWAVGRDASPARLAVILRTFRLPFLWIGGIVVVVGVVAGRGLLVHVFGDRIGATGLGATDALLLVAAIGLRFPMSVYTGFLAGVGRVGAGSAIVMVGDAARVLITLPVMLWWSRSLTVFFLVHCLASVAMLAVAASRCRKMLGEPALAAARPDWSILSGAGSLIVGSGALSLLFVTTNSIDKLILPRFATAEEFGGYVALGQLAAVPFTVVHAVWTASHPRLLSALAGANDAATAAIFRLTAGTMAALACAAIVFVFAAAHWLVRRWLGEGVRLAGGPLILALLSLGYVAAGLSHLAISVQQARRRMTASALSLLACLALAAVIVLAYPGIVNPVGCAALWCCVYFAYLLVGAGVFGAGSGGMRRIWLFHALLPLLASLFLAVACYRSFQLLSGLWQPAAAALAAALVLLVVFAGNSELRVAGRAAWRRLVPQG